MTRFIIFTEGNKVVDTTAWKLYQLVEDATYVDDAGDMRHHLYGLVNFGHIAIPLWLD